MKQAEKNFTSRLMHWHSTENKRTMPWKGEKDPYKIWLSEVILQQTRVSQGLSYYKKFVGAYPSVGDLANARDEDVYKLWEGLGYYSRCKNLLATARIVRDKYDGVFPKTYSAILQLKGIGPYTASAIASFAFDLPHAVVDGNVYRVLSRFFGETVPIDSTIGKRLFNELAHKLLYQPEAAAYNQAIMDFGAVVCKPVNPLCEECPLQNGCAAFKLNLITELPVKEKQLVRTSRYFTYFVFVVNDTVLVKKRTANDIWQNLDEFYLHETPAPQKWTKRKIKLVLASLGISSFKLISISSETRQQLTHQNLNGQFILVKLAEVPEALQLFTRIPLWHISNPAFPKLISSYLQTRPFIGL